MPLPVTYVPKSRLNQKTKARSLNMDTSFERTTSPRTTASALMVIAGGEEDAVDRHELFLVAIDRRTLGARARKGVAASDPWRAAVRG